jgi:ABC-2 type transport system ATP-binding protein
MIEVRELTKRFGLKTAVNQLSFDVKPGVVTGFLGPNGSGKSTTMRCMVGLDRANGGRALFDGKPYATLHRPLNEVGTLLDAGYVHPGRSARNHLRWLAASNSLPKSKVDEMLALVGLTDVGKNRVKTFSLGMRQRLGLAGVLLGDPKTIILDEPANGLDPEGIRWIRDVLKHLAVQGRTVLVSSHLLSEMALIADDLVVIGQGTLLDQCTVSEFVEKHADRWVRVAGPNLAPMLAAVSAAGAQVSPTADPHVAEVRGMDMAKVGEAAAQHATVLHELSLQTGSLEDAYLTATSGVVEYHGGSL